MDDVNTATIEFLPICSNCKKEIRSIIDYRFEPLSQDGCEISPLICPECGAIFTSITIPRTLPFNNSLRAEICNRPYMTSEDMNI